METAAPGPKDGAKRELATFLRNAGLHLPVRDVIIQALKLIPHRHTAVLLSVHD